MPVLNFRSHLCFSVGGDNDFQYWIEVYDISLSMVARALLSSVSAITTSWVGVSAHHQLGRWC